MDVYKLSHRDETGFRTHRCSGKRLEFPKASRAGVSAAIRGFAEKRDKTPPGSVENVLKNSVKTFGNRSLQSSGNLLRREPHSPAS
jgi:hypothetical protein